MQCVLYVGGAIWEYLWENLWELLYMGYMCLKNNLVFAWVLEAHGVFQMRELRTAPLRLTHH